MPSHFKGLLRIKEQTTKVLCGWTRRYYRKNVPVAVTIIAAQFAGQIRAQFSRNNCHCVSTPDNFQTVTVICKIPEHLPTLCRGTLTVSTQFGMHRWVLQINKYSKHMIIGIAQYPWKNGFFALTIDIDAYWTMSAYKQLNNKTKSNRFQKNPPANVEDGDKVKIIIHGEKVGFAVFNDEGSKWQFSYQIDPGEYNLFVNLEQESDSVSIIDYTQLM